MQGGSIMLLDKGPRSKSNIEEELTDSEQLQIMEAYAEAEDNLFTDWAEDDYDFQPEE